MSETTEPLLVSLPESRRLLSIGKTKLNDLCNDGQLERVHVGSHALITMTSIKAFIERLLRD